MFHTLRDLFPGGSAGASPFVVRGRGGKEPGSNHPAISGRSSTASNNSSDSNSDSTSDDDLTTSSPSSRQPAVSPLAMVTRLLEKREPEEKPPLFPAIKRHTTVQVHEPGKRDMLLYKRYVNFERRSNPKYKVDLPVVLTVSSAFSIDSSVDVIPPTVSKASKQTYKEYIERSTGKIVVPPESLDLYKKYVNFNC